MASVQAVATRPERNRRAYLRLDEGFFQGGQVAAAVRLQANVAQVQAGRGLGRGRGRRFGGRRRGDDDDRLRRRGLGGQRRGDASGDLGRLRAGVGLRAAAGGQEQGQYQGQHQECSL